MKVTIILALCVLYAQATHVDISNDYKEKCLGGKLHQKSEILKISGEKGPKYDEAIKDLKNEVQNKIEKLSCSAATKDKILTLLDCIVRTILKNNFDAKDIQSKSKVIIDILGDLTDLGGGSCVDSKTGKSLGKGKGKGKGKGGLLGGVDLLDGLGLGGLLDGLLDLVEELLETVLCLVDELLDRLLGVIGDSCPDDIDCHWEDNPKADKLCGLYGDAVEDLIKTIDDAIDEVLDAIKTKKNAVLQCDDEDDLLKVLECKS